MSSDIRGRLDAINAKLQAELATRSRLSDALGKAIVVIWMGVAVFFGLALSEPNLKITDLINQEISHVERR
ncbi:hypothetical protein HJB80_02925 [Rhizobium lentis]|uniref:hypothetical protein n=1 Tax=Rhizobium lentis TaxID=1138194 RepID=UPI001C829B7A|nr:hypothetical protein [Rhizobium lentis]MBX5131646.1 hypothetical protein [Rhizobium lentis]